MTSDEVQMRPVGVVMTWRAGYIPAWRGLLVKRDLFLIECVTMTILSKISTKFIPNPFHVEKVWDIFGEFSCSRDNGNYSDIAWALMIMPSQITVNRLFVHQLVWDKTDLKKIIWLSNTGTLNEGYTCDDQRVLLAKDQWYGKCFHDIMSFWLYYKQIGALTVFAMDLWAHNPNLLKNNYCSYHKIIIPSVSILHKPQQLSYHDMCKIVTCLHNWNHN